MQIPTELLPRVFQANVDRFYSVVVVPTLASLSPYVGSEDLHSDTRVALQLAAEVGIHTYRESARAFALTLAAIFERQVQALLLRVLSQADPVVWGPFKPLLGRVAEERAVDLAYQGIGAILIEHHLVANVVRHGDGRSFKELVAQFPGLVRPEVERDFGGLLSGIGVPSERLVVSDQDLRRYARAIMQFWGLSDREANAVIDPPY